MKGSRSRFAKLTLNSLQYTYELKWSLLCMTMSVRAWGWALSKPDLLFWDYFSLWGSCALWTTGQLGVGNILLVMVSCRSALCRPLQVPCELTGSGLWESDYANEGINSQALLCFSVSPWFSEWVWIPKASWGPPHVLVVVRGCWPAGLFMECPCREMFRPMFWFLLSLNVTFWQSALWSGRVVKHCFALALLMLPSR